MNSSKSEDSILPSHQSGSAVHDNRENALAKRTTPTYELATFSGPAVDRNLGLSPAGHLRLSPESHPRLVSNSCVGLSSSQSPETLSQKLKVPVGKGLEIKPDLAGRSLTGVNVRSFIGANLPIAPLGSRLVTLVATEEKPKSDEKEKK
jgi:hypothetical protein